MRIFRLICRSRRHRRGPGHRGRPRRIPQDRLGIRKSRSIQFRPEWCCPKISRSSRLTLVKGGRRPPFLRSVSKSKYVRPKRGSSSSLVQIFEKTWPRTWAEALPDEFAHQPPTAKGRVLAQSTLCYGAYNKERSFLLNLRMNSCDPRHHLICSHDGIPFKAPTSPCEITITTRRTY